MDSITIRLPEETLEEIEQEAESRDLSKSEVIREWFRERDELQSEYEELQSEYEELQTECDRLHRERRQLLEHREEHTELVRTVERQQSLAERKASAGLMTRAKWWFTGVPAEGSDE
jgi:uncharacterized coiled-coil DUF342 family protein